MSGFLRRVSVYFKNSDCKVSFYCQADTEKSPHLCRFSKHPFIADSSVVTALPDGTPSSMNFADNRNNRFK